MAGEVLETVATEVKDASRDGLIGRVHLLSMYCTKQSNLRTWDGMGRLRAYGCSASIASPALTELLPFFPFSAVLVSSCDLALSKIFKV